MPQGKPRPADIAAQAKRVWIPQIAQMPEFPSRSILYPDSSLIVVDPKLRRSGRLRVAVIDGDPVDVALGWSQCETAVDDRGLSGRIPVLNMTNERRAAGDWESGLMAPEECFARRSNLARALVTPWGPEDHPHHPIPPMGGIYSPYVVVFRDGPDQYDLWKDLKSLPVISVPPVRRPKLDETGLSYSFEQEKELMMEKMRTILRIAAHWNHKNICLSAFGSGPIFRNPTREIAQMWRLLLFQDEEFKGVFSNVVFAIERSEGQRIADSVDDFDIFEQEFKPSNILKSSIV